MLILTQNGKNLIGGDFLISYDSPADGINNVVYQNFSNNKSIIIGKYDTEKDCLERIAIINMTLNDNENIKINKATSIKGAQSIQSINMPSSEIINEIHKKRENK